MKLYYFPGSCALAPQIVLTWLDADFDAIRIEKGDPSYRKINPLGVVPALDYDGRIHTQADAILHLLSDLHPEAKLGGDGTPNSSYELNQWMAFLTGDLHPAFFPFFGPQRFTTKSDDESIEAVKAAGEERVAGYLEHLAAHLDGRDFLVGDRRSIADAYAIPMLRWARLLQKPLTEYPALTAYLDRWEADAGVRKALNEQGLT